MVAIAHVTFVHFAIAIAYIYAVLIYFTVAFFIRPANYFNLLSEPIMFFISSTHVSYMFLRAFVK